MTNQFPKNHTKEVRYVQDKRRKTRNLFLIDNTTSRKRTLRFLYDGTHEEFVKALFALGETPLPKYMNRPAEPEDVERYQTIYATEEGAVVAPAAGLHFSRELMKRLEIKDCNFVYLTVHSGLGIYREMQWN